MVGPRLRHCGELEHGFGFGQFGRTVTAVLSCAAIELIWGERPRARRAGSRRTFTIFSPRLVPMNGGARLRRALILQREESGLDGSLAPPRGHADFCCTAVFPAHRRRLQSSRTGDSADWKSAIQQVLEICATSRGALIGLDCLGGRVKDLARIGK